MDRRQFGSERDRRSRVPRAAMGVGVAALGVVAVALEHGFASPVLPALALGSIMATASWLALVISGDLRWRDAPPRRWSTKIGAVCEPALAVAILGEALGVRPAVEIITVAILIACALRLNGLLARTLTNPSMLFPASFAVMIAISTALLKLPASTPRDQPITWIDACFTATSAVCVTGLGVRDTASGFTEFGQAVILGSIQVGGLGVMIFGSTLALLFGARLSFRENVTLSHALDEYPAHRISRFVWFIVLTTVALETVGAAILYLTWPDAASLGPGDRAWQAVFHSVSSFCNAGFDITGQSMVGLRSSPVPYLGIIPMIILGGLGFVVLEDLFLRASRPTTPEGRRRRLSTHTRLVLTTTLALLVLGAVPIFLAQLAVPGQSPWQRVLDAVFMSTTARTAGFTSVPMDELRPGSVFTLMLLMAVGGSPGSTAGGMKTTVLAVLVLAVVSTVRRREDIEVFGRAIPDALVKRAATIAFGLVAVVCVATLTLDLTERAPLDRLLFEAISAATTTGLSLNVTGTLSDPGRVVIIITMFLGRVGPLAMLATLLGGGPRATAYRLPRDSVSLG